MMYLGKTTKTLVICSIFIAGIIFTILNIIPLYLLILIFAVFCSFFTKKISFKFLLIVFLAAGFSIIYTVRSMPDNDALSKLAPDEMILQGRVVSQLNDSSDKTKFELNTYSVLLKNKYKKINAKTLLTIKKTKNDSNNIQIGDIIKLKAKVLFPHNATNPAQFDYSKYLKYQRIFTVSYSNYKDIVSIENPKFGQWLFLQKFSHITNKIVSVHSKFLKSPNLEILGGVVLGDYAVPPPNDIKKDFMNAGLIHLLAASGMNVTFIYGLWFFISRKLRFPFKLSVIIGAGFVLFYSLLTGVPPSVMRALLIFEFILFGKLIDRKADNLTLIVFICTLMLLYDPYLITNIGFQLSFMVSFGLLLCMPILTEKTKKVPELLSGVILVPLVAQIWAAPIQLFHFNSFTVYAILANLIVLPLTVIITYFGFFSSIFTLIPFVGEKICFLLDKAAEPFVSILLFVSKYTSSLPHSIIYFATPKIMSIIFFYTLIILMIIAIKYDFSKKILNYSILILVVLFAITIFYNPLKKELKITFFDVGESDSILIDTPDHKRILVDTGNAGYKTFSSAKNIIVPYFRVNGIKKLDTLLLTHPDKDHIGGTIEILSSIKTGMVYQNGETSKSKTYKKIQNFIKKKNVKNQILENNTKLNLDNNIEILAIKQDHNIDSSSHNEHSIILYIKYKKFSALLMGDAEKDSLPLIKKFVKEPLYIIKVGHHGSKKSLDNDFIHSLNPKFAVISVGKNHYSHPSNKILSILEKNKIKDYRTDKDTAILLNTNGDNVEIHRYKDNL